MKKKLIMASIGMLAISVTTIISCGKDEDFDESCELDVEFRTPITKSSQIDSEFETSATQTIGNQTNNKYAIPKNEDECMLYAILSIAKKNNIPITIIELDKKTGEFIKKTGTIGRTFTGAQAYEGVKNYATSQEWPQCDVEGRVHPNSISYKYNGGTMAPSVAKSIGKQSGILQGAIMHFDSYEALNTCMLNPDFNAKHPKGTYIICNENHAAVCNGVDRNGNIKYTDANNDNAKYRKDQQKGTWTLIF